MAKALSFVLMKFDFNRFFHIGITLLRCDVKQSQGFSRYIDNGSSLHIGPLLIRHFQRLYKLKT